MRVITVNGKTGVTNKPLTPLRNASSRQVLLKNSAARHEGGFTLIEVMLAISITAFIAMLGYQGLSAATAAANSHEKQVKLLSEIQLPLTILERDIRHVVNRGISDELGSNPRNGGLIGGSLTDYPLELTRRGWDNPRNLPRGELQRVRYVLEEEKLYRESWSVLDRTTEDDGKRRTLLLGGVTELKLAFLDSDSGGGPGVPSRLGGAWVEEWADKDNLPVAIDFTMNVKKFGQVRRVFGITAN